MAGLLRRLIRYRGVHDRVANSARHRMASLRARLRICGVLLLVVVVLGLISQPVHLLAQQPKSSKRTAAVPPNQPLPEVAEELEQPFDQQPQQPAAGAQGFQLPSLFQTDGLVSPAGLTSTMNLLLVLTVLTLAPSIFIMTTCFVRFIVVLGLLRQALGTQQLPPNQVLISLSLFLTFTVMSPVWSESYYQGIRPYTHNEPIRGLQPDESPLARTLINTIHPLREFMIQQIDRTQNWDALWMFVDYQQDRPGFVRPKTYSDASLSVLLPAYMLSELKTAFLIGFQLYLPFVIIDMVIASVLISMGMMMLPPVLISLPFKLLLFVLIDGWTLTVGMMLDSVEPYSTTGIVFQTIQSFV